MNKDEKIKKFELELYALGMAKQHIRRYSKTLDIEIDATKKCLEELRQRGK